MTSRVSPNSIITDPQELILIFLDRYLTSFVKVQSTSRPFSYHKLYTLGSCRNLCLKIQEFLVTFGLHSQNYKIYWILVTQPPHKTEVNKKYLVLCITSRPNYTRLIQVLERAGRSPIQFFATISISNIYFIKQSGP